MSATAAIKVLHVATAKPYDVHIGPGAIDRIAELIGPHVRRLGVIVAPQCGEIARRIAALVPHVEITSLQAPEAEQAKSVEFLSHAWSRLAEAGFTRSDMIVGVGGGATTDVAGFIAASLLRGIDFVTVPTTVLAMVDAAVGGKTGINIPEGKNLVGAFHEPVGVLCDTSALASLPVEEFRSGFAEIIKCGFIADPSILDDVEHEGERVFDASSELLASLIARGIAVKAATVAADLHEQGTADGGIGREALNYGHTLGHAIEAHEHFGTRHGEAISIGMVFVAEVAHRMGLIDEALLRRHRAILSQVGLPTSYRGELFETLLTAMKRDKKTRGDVIRLVVLDGLARPVIAAAPDSDILRSAYDAIC